MIVLRMPYESYENVFNTVIRWARFGNLFTYDATAQRVELTNAPWISADNSALGRMDSDPRVQAPVRAPRWGDSEFCVLLRQRNEMNHARLAHFCASQADSARAAPTWAGGAARCRE